MERSAKTASILALLGVLVGSAQAQEDIVKQEELKKELDEKAKLKEDGWKYSLSLGSNAALNNTQAVVGTPVDGTTFQIGVVLDGSANLRAGQHEWRNTLKINHTQTRTPVVPKFVKTADDFRLQSMYLYELQSVPWLGPFARARLQTALFDGQFVDGSDQNLNIPGEDDANGDAPGTRTLPANEEFKLTSAFEPFVLRQSGGFFARPLSDPDLAVTFTLGLGAQEIFAEGGYALTDNADTADVIELSRLDSSQQAGLESELEAGGAVNKQLTWGFNLNLLHPFVINVDNPLLNELEGLDLTNVEAGIKLSMKLNKWASVDFTSTAKKVPLISKEWQLTNGLLVSAAFNLL